jgi:hypothetical protein
MEAVMYSAYLNCLFFEMTSSVGTKFMKFKTHFEKLNQDSEPTLIKRNTLKYVVTNVYSSIIVLNMG